MTTKPSKTVKVAVYPDGTRRTFRRSTSRGWWIKEPGGGSVWCSHQSMLVAHVEADGATVISEPNPEYERWQRRRLPALERALNDLLT